MATASSSFFEMGKRPPKMTGRRQLHYSERGFDWQPFFDKLDGPSPAPSIRALAAAADIPHTTLSWHYRKYKDALANADEQKLAVAQGVIAAAQGHLDDLLEPAG